MGNRVKTCQQFSAWISKSKDLWEIDTSEKKRARDITQSRSGLVFSQLEFDTISSKFTSVIN